MSLQSCYVGESFPVEFECRDSRNPDRVVDSATYSVRADDGAILQGGQMTIGEDGHTVSFRFTPQNAGMVTIIVSYSMGSDKWQARFLVDVRE